MKKILVTGFLPFNGRDINPSQMIVKRLTAPENVILAKHILHVEYGRAGEELKNAVEEEQPDILLSLGQAGNVPHISVERVAVNLNNSRTANGKNLFPDQAGATPVDEPIVMGGPDAYFSTLPVWELISASNEAGVPAAASYSAGTFICNHVMYTGCHIAKQRGNLISGFVHVPFLPEQLVGQTQTNVRYSMPFEDMLRGVQSMVELLSGR